MFFNFCKQRKKIITFPMYPHYESVNSRCESFRRVWYTKLVQDPKKLINAGFFYTGISDHVQCFYCGCVVENWTETDIPLLRHFQASPKCMYIQQNAISIIDMEKKHLKSNEDRLCKICFEDDYSTAVLPCGHVIACEKCSIRMIFCAVCRTKIDKIINVYF